MVKIQVTKWLFEEVWNIEHHQKKSSAGKTHSKIWEGKGKTRIGALPRRSNRWKQTAWNRMHSARKATQALENKVVKIMIISKIDQGAKSIES